jgi:hypothetical protein
MRSYMTGENPIERAFELARSGECQDMRELEQKLKREGFTNVLSHLSGPSIRRQINDLMAKAPQPRD